MNARLFLAEREGFEPPVPARRQRISSAPRSTTPAPLRQPIFLHESSGIIRMEGMGFRMHKSNFLKQATISRCFATTPVLDTGRRLPGALKYCAFSGSLLMPGDGEQHRSGVLYIGSRPDSARTRPMQRCATAVSGQIIRASMQDASCPQTER